MRRYHPARPQFPKKAGLKKDRFILLTQSLGSWRKEGLGKESQHSCDAKVEAKKRGLPETHRADLGPAARRAARLGNTQS